MHFMIKEEQIVFFMSMLANLILKKKMLQETFIITVKSRKLKHFP